MTILTQSSRRSYSWGSKNWPLNIWTLQTENVKKWQDFICKLNYMLWENILRKMPILFQNLMSSTIKSPENNLAYGFYLIWKHLFLWNSSSFDSYNWICFPINGTSNVLCSQDLNSFSGIWFYFDAVDSNNQWSLSLDFSNTALSLLIFNSFWAQ